VFFGPDSYRFVRFLQQHWPVGVRHIVDLGAGSGAGGIAAAKLAPGSRVTLVDTNGRALALARVNAAAGTKLLMQGAFGSGLGRYVGGLVPDVAFRSDGSISPIGTTSWVGGVEQQISPRLSLGGYYSGVVADDTFDRDTGGSYIGFGYPGASHSNNRRIQEVTGTASYAAKRVPSAEVRTVGPWSPTSLDRGGRGGCWSLEKHMVGVCTHPSGARRRTAGTRP